ncbi:unnamed protein product [Cunninghamella blakesleeana]
MATQRKLLVANCGEIAIRILTAAAELGYQTVAVYADNNDKAHCAFANEAIQLETIQSFLKPEHIIHAAKSTQATFIHPGYGFLSESTLLAEQCQQNNIQFIGPSKECIEAVGDKVAARQVAIAAGIPVIPGTQESITNPSDVHQFGEKYGYPIMLKARDGGGGRGIRMVQHPNEIDDALKRCTNESPSKQVFIEKAIVGAKHIEVQIIGDHHGNVIHLFERDCSIQRRYQKILEVAPCPSLPSNLRKQIHEAAVRLARHIQYNSAGTVEFLVTNDAFYFLEVNPRIQVEHTISEQITNVDIVQTQILVAMGKNLHHDLHLTQQFIQPFHDDHHHRVSIQARVVAENPHQGNSLSVGKISHVSFPVGSYGIRVDTWLHDGCFVLPSFDSLLAKIIVTGNSLEDALSKMAIALQRTVIVGVETNLDFLTALVMDKDYLCDNLKYVHIKSLEERTDDLLKASLKWTQQRKKKLSLLSIPSSSSNNNNDMTLQFKPGDAFNIELSDKNNQSSSQIHSIQFESIQLNNFPNEIMAQIQTTIPNISNPSTLKLTKKSAIGGGQLRRKANTNHPHEVPTPITGMVVEISVKQHDIVELGQELFVMTAMKMETVVKSPLRGRVQSINTKPNELLESGDLVIELSDLKDNKL